MLELYHAASPAFYAKNIKTPLLILHSEGDSGAPSPKARCSSPR